MFSPAPGPAAAFFFFFSPGCAGPFICDMWDLVPGPGIKPGPFALELQGSNLGPLHWNYRVLVPGPPGKTQFLLPNRGEPDSLIPRVVRSSNFFFPFYSKKN